jgi:hypothetical protein
MSKGTPCATCRNPVGVGTWALWRGRGRDWGTGRTLALVAVTAALAGRALEQQFGVPQAADGLLAWALVGLLAALPAVGTARPAPTSVRAIPVSARAGAWALACLAVVAAGALTLPFTYRVLAAGREAALAASAERDGNVVEALERIESAMRLGLASAACRVRAADLLDRFGLTTQGVEDDVLLRGRWRRRPRGCPARRSR